MVQDSTEKRYRNPKVQLLLSTETHPLWRKVELFSADSSVALHEFLFGITLLPRSKKNLQEWNALKGLFTYYGIDETIAAQAAHLRIALRQKGWQLEAIDSLIGIVALQNNLQLLTTDKDFMGVPNLQSDSWC